MLDLGLEDHVEFDDRFLTIEEIADLLAATDVFVTPYRGREQIASGALTFGIAAGCGVVSTPYWYAQDMLASGAGELVPFGDSAALADAVCRYIEEPERLEAARAEARRIGAQLAWPSVAEATASVLREAVELAPRRRRPVARLDPQLVSMRTDHLLTLVDDVGIVQHANGVIPNRESGYCVDDVARLAVVALELARRGDEQVWTSIVYRSLAFLQDATDPRGGDAELHGLRPALARRAARRRSRRPFGLGTRRDPLDGLGTRASSARRSACSTRSSARSDRRGVVAHRRLRRPRPGAPRSPTGSSRRRSSCSSGSSNSWPTRYETHASGGLALVRGRAHLRQRARSRMR